MIIPLLLFFTLPVAQLEAIPPAIPKALTEEVRFIEEAKDIDIVEEIEEIEEVVKLEQVYSYETMMVDTDKLIELYPNIEKRVIGKSRLGNDILAIRLGTGSINVLIHATHHAREWATTNITMKMLEDYAQRDLDILKRVSIWFVPMVNPDGAILQQEGLEAMPEVLHESLIDINGGSRDFKRWKANLAGVDLNQQYPAYRKKSAGSYSYANYPGKYPLMEPESFALYKFTHEIKPEIVISYHSSGEIIFYPTYMEDDYIAKKIGQLTGYNIQSLPPEKLAGGYVDWFVKEFNRPAVTVEIGQYVQDTNIPPEEIPSIWEKNKEVGIYIMEEAEKRVIQALKERGVSYEKGNICMLLR